jgi:hypothetical protein
MKARKGLMVETHVQQAVRKFRDSSFKGIFEKDSKRRQVLNGLSDG